jgi:Fe-S cluster assembly ATP-binding protein
MHLLQIKNLSFQIGGQSIFDGLDLSINPGEIHALVGTNGSRKSSLAYVILVVEDTPPNRRRDPIEGRSINALRLLDL